MRQYTNNHVRYLFSQCILFLFLIFAAHIVYAADVGSIDFSKISNDADKSLQYLSEIFGHVGEVLIYPGQSIIGQVFLIFNQ